MLLDSYYPCSCRGNTSTARGAVRGTGCRETCAGSEDRAGALHPIVLQDWEGGQGKKIWNEHQVLLANHESWVPCPWHRGAPGSVWQCLGSNCAWKLSAVSPRILLAVMVPLAQAASPCKGFSWQKLQGQGGMECPGLPACTAIGTM